MKLLKEINHREQLNKQGKALTREAVRGVILNKDKILLLFSSELGAYMIPGGGKETGETKEEAIIREILEECGALVVNIEKELGIVIENNETVEREYAIFKMISCYYLCNVEENNCKPKLDQYDEELGLNPVWVDIEEAINKNKLLLNSNSPKASYWFKRDTFILEYIMEKLCRDK